ncbi:MAG TPA: DUF1206 domain-containing protein [Pseudonocardia sp.]|nr:DUF1206 domain-containing protein [Pseudonocardia sp.]
MVRPLSQLRRLVHEGSSDAPGRIFDVLGRVGLVGYGVVHLLVAWLALRVAIGLPGGAADAQGAVGTLARTPFGVVALALAAVGLIAFSVWQLTAAAVGFGWVGGGERLRKRAGAAAKAIATAALAGIVLDYLTGRGAASGDPGARRLTADVLALPGGRLLLAAAALGILALAAAMTYTGVRRTFLGDLDLRRLGPAMRRAVEVTGAVGHLARAVALAVIGLLAGAAALFGDPRRAGGLDAALRALGETGPGSALLVVVATGFAAYGVFCVADAATRRA